MRYIRAFDVDDLTQDILTVAWKRLGKLRDPEALDAWIRGIARRRCWNERRKRRPILTDTGEVDRVDLGLGPYDRRLAWELRTALHRAAATLDPLQRAALVRRYEDGDSVNEVERFLRSAGRRGTAHGYLQTLRRRVRAELEPVYREIAA